MKPNDQVLEVWGEFACFSRPEFKVERFSYPLITPSAVRGIYDAIFCKPSRDGKYAQFRWQVTQIELLSPPVFIGLRRNEVKDKATVKTAWLEGREAPEPLWADGTADVLGTDMKGRTQRQTMALKDVRYRLHARIRTWNGFHDRLPALEAQFRRRASSGKCVYQPYFGCREFPAYFELAADQGPYAYRPLEVDMEVGLMLYDVFDLSCPGTDKTPPRVSLFRCVVKRGLVDVPDYDNDDVLKSV